MTLAANSVLKITSLVLLALAGAIWFLAGKPWAPPAAILPEQDMLQVQALRLPLDNPVTLNEMLERPLFWEGRRPQEQVAEETPPPPEEPETDPFEGMEIYGVYGEGRQKAGGIIAKLDNETRRIQLKTKLENGWTLTRITDTEAIFNKSKQSHKIPLRRASQPATPSQPVQAGTKADEPENNEKQMDKEEVRQNRRAARRARIIRR